MVALLLRAALAAAAVAAVVAQDAGTEDRTAAPEAYTAEEDGIFKAPPKNHAVCYEVVNSWFVSREQDKTRAQITTLDATCSVFDGQPLACNVKSSRTDPSLTADQKNALCTTVGAHDQRCLSNPCNNLNTGDCTLQVSDSSFPSQILLCLTLLALRFRFRPSALQNSKGQCYWFWGKEFTIYNKYLVSQGLSPLPTHGWYVSALGSSCLPSLTRCPSLAARAGQLPQPLQPARVRPAGGAVPDAQRARALRVHVVQGRRRPQAGRQGRRVPDDGPADQGRLRARQRQGGAEVEHHAGHFQLALPVLHVLCDVPEHCGRPALRVQEALLSGLASEAR